MATANNILAHQSLFLSSIVVGLISEFLFIAVVLLLYRLLKGVNQQHAALMVILILLDAPLAFLSLANQMATLAFLRGTDFLTVFDKPQRNALAMLFLHWNNQETFVSEMFWGLWLLPLGLLVFRSGFFPRFLGGWLIINGFAYVALSFTALLLPQKAEMLFRIAMPALFGEVTFTLWLLIKGAKVQPLAPQPGRIEVTQTEMEYGPAFAVKTQPLVISNPPDRRSSALSIVSPTDRLIDYTQEDFTKGQHRMP